MPPHPLTNFEIQKLYGNEPRFDGVFSRNNLPKKMRDGSYIINLDEYTDVGRHSITFFCNKNNRIYFDSFGVEHIRKEMKKVIEELSGNKNIVSNIFRRQANNSVMCGYSYIGIIDFMLVGKKLTDYTILFSPYAFKKTNNNIILSYFKNEWK